MKKDQQKPSAKSLAECTYWAKGLCAKHGCQVRSLINQGRRDGTLSGIDGARRIRKMKADAKSQGCPEF